MSWIYKLKQYYKKQLKPFARQLYKTPEGRFHSVFTGSVLLMFLQKRECYNTNEFMVDPLYFSLESYFVRGAMGAFFIGLTGMFVFFMIFVLTTVWNKGKMPEFWWWGWLALGIHQVHYIVQTFLNKTYYSGTVTAYLVVCYGFLFAYMFFKNRSSRYTIRFWMGGYLGTLILYIFYLTYISNPFVRNRKKQFPGVYIDCQKEIQFDFLKKKKVVVVGGSRGISLSIVRQLKKYGATVIAGCRQHKAAAVEATSAYKLDISDPEATREFIEQVLKTHGPVDVVILSGGTYSKERGFQNYNIFFTDTLKFVEAVKNFELIKENGQIINLTSLAILDYSEKERDKNHLPWRAYVNAKYHLLGALGDLFPSAKEGVQVCHFYPGIVPTESNPLTSWLPDIVCTGLIKLHLMNPPTQIADVLVHFIGDNQYAYERREQVHHALFNLHMEERLATNFRYRKEGDYNLSPA